MIKILVISDSHYDTSLINKLYLSHQDYDFFLHCGDSQVEPYMLNPFTSVKGNCDYGSDYPSSKRIKTKYGDILIEHGHYRHDKEYVLEQNAFIFLYGHTHKKDATKIDDYHYMFNPGSLTRPRDDNMGSYLELFLDDNKVDYKFHFINEL